jgi:hypothetical protein
MALGVRRGRWEMREPGQATTVQLRVQDRMPDLVITLASVLTGLVLADMVMEARERMRLWPLDLQSLRTWCQLLGTGLTAIVAWVQFSHVGAARRRLPIFSDSIVTFAYPLGIMIVTTFIGRPEGWSWFYGAAAYLVISIVSVVWHFYLVTLEPELEGLKAVVRPTGFLGLLYLAAPTYAVVGWADQHGWISPVGEVLFAAAASPSALLVGALFFRDWLRAIAVPASPGASLT